MRIRTAFLASLALISVVALPAAAQDRTGTVEISPFGGASFGGRLHGGSTAIFSNDVDIADSGAWGVRLGYNVNRWFAMEAAFTHAKSDIKSLGGDALFGTGQKLGTWDEQHYDMNAVFNFGRGRVIPYFTIGGGFTRFDADVPGVDSSPDTRFTGNLGAGVKFFVDPHFGFRFDGRYRSSYLNDNGGCNSHDSYYCDDHHHNNDNSQWYGSGEVTGALTIAF